MAVPVSACGDDEEDEPTATSEVEPQRTAATTPGPAEGTEQGDGARAQAAGDMRSGGGRDRGAGDAHAGCVFEAPEGRLAEREVAIELDGVSCRDATALARAAALGQPAGANLTIEKRGFECEPSTLTKGANVSYTCTGAPGSLTFDVVWSE